MPAGLPGRPFLPAVDSVDAEIGRSIEAGLGVSALLGVAA